MSINDIETLVSYIFACDDKEEIKNLILAYGNSRHASGIESAGQKARDFYAKINALRGKRIKNSILNWDEDNGTITLKELTKFIVGIDDQLRVMVGHGDKAHADAASDISCILYDRIGDLKIDRRLLFSNDED